MREYLQAFLSTFINVKQSNKTFNTDRKHDDGKVSLEWQFANIDLDVTGC